MARKVLNGLDLTGTKLVNLGDGTAPADAVNRSQLDAAIRGVTWKLPARAASTANVTLASPGASMDGVTLTANDRVLLKNQTTGSENGIYVWTGAAAALTRATDADSATELDGAAVFVLEGTTNADKAFTQNASPVVVGTTSLVWAQLGGGGTTYTAGNGLQLASTTFSVLLDAASGLIVSGTGLKIDPAVVNRKFAQAIGNGALTSIAVTHNLATLDIDVTLIEVSTGAVVETDWAATNTNTVTLTFATAPSTGQYRVVVEG
ncbi:MAG: hypothetical protein ACRCZP_11680 [Phycicoccus sp.]